MKSAKNFLLLLFLGLAITPAVIGQSEGKIIPWLFGRDAIYEEDEVFSYRDINFAVYDLNRPEKSTPKTVVQIKKISKSATASVIFESLSSNLDTLCLSQAQIIYFCRNYRSKLSLNGATIFLIKEYGRYFAVYVRYTSVGLRVFVQHLEDNHIWHGEGGYYVVIPQID
jgi:hypothetical protein